jgi:hypothetical protein
LYTIRCNAGAKTPTLAPVGIEHVMVNGTAVVANGNWCGDGVMAGEWIGGTNLNPPNPKVVTA